MGAEQVVVESGGAGGGSGDVLGSCGQYRETDRPEKSPKKEIVFPFWKHTSWK
ncbi:hypothetical protein WJ971_30975 [Achromobacter xylosoxidans]